MADNSSVLGVFAQHPALTASCLFLLFILLGRTLLNRHKPANVPGIRYGTIPGLRSWQGALAFLRDPEGCLKEGYEKYPHGYFKIATITTENVVVNDADKVAEYLSAPDDVLNVQDAINNGIQFKWTMGPGVYHRPYHIPLVRGKLTQSIANTLPALQTEVSSLLNSSIGAAPEWKTVPIADEMVRMIAKVGNLAMGGEPLAHNEAYITAAIQYTLDLMLSAALLRPLPDALKDYFVYLTPAYRTKKRTEQIIGPYIAQRLAETDAGKTEKRSDMLQWLIDSAPPVERTVPQLVERLLALDVAAIHTTTMTLTQAIYTLCSESSVYLPALRAEITQNCPSGDFTKESLDKLVRLDSFFRECGRLGPIGNIGSGRYARQAFTFKDGTVIPRGSTVCGNVVALHQWSEKEEFDGFRFSKSVEESGGKQPQMVSTGTEYLAFGHGRHAWYVLLLLPPAQGLTADITQ